MAQSAPVTKIYQLKTLGFSKLNKELEEITKKFNAIKNAKLSAQGKLAATQDVNEIKKYAQEVSKLQVEEQKLRTERQRMLNEQKAATIARQKEIQQERDRIKGLKDSSGWYRVLTTDIRELGAAIKNVNNQGDPVSFRGEVLGFDQAIAKLQQLTAAEQNFRRQFARDQLLVGEYTSGIVQAFKKMGLGDLVGGQITKAQARLNELNGTFDKLQQELRETRQAGTGSLDAIERELIDNRKEAINLAQSISQLQTQFRATGDVGNQITSSLNTGFRNMGRQIGSLVFQYLGLQALFSKTIQGINEAKLSSDQTTELQVVIGLTADEVDRLNVSLSKLDTRTTLTGLQKIADVAAKAGVTKDNILGVTEAIDQVKIAFGKDFGDIETGTETFAKLINIFFEDGEITGDRILKIGNSIRSLANESVASVPYLTDFSGRMAGIKQASNITLPDILGLGAGFEEFKQSAETTSTALVKVIPKLAKDIEVFSEIAGMTTEAFKELLQSNPAEALIRVSEGFVAGKADVEVFANQLADAGIEAGRITTVIATLGGKADIFRERIRRAGDTIVDSTAITEAFNQKNTNLAATMDKLNKAFTDTFASKTFQLSLSAIVGVVSLLLSSLPALITILGLLAVTWGVQNARMLALRLQVIAYNIAIGASYVAALAANIVYVAQQIALWALQAAYAGVTRAAALFGITLRSTPLGLILTGVGLLITAFAAFGREVNAASRELSNQNEIFKLQRELRKEAIKATQEQRAEAKLLVGVVNDLSISETTRLATLKKLIQISPIFQQALDGDRILYDKLNLSLLQYEASLLRISELEASRIRQSRELQKLDEINVKIQDIEFATSTKNFKDLDKELSDLIYKRAFANRTFTQKLLQIMPSEKDFLKAAELVVDDLEAARTTQTTIIENVEKVYREKQVAVDKAEKERTIAATSSGSRSSKPSTDPAIQAVEVDIKALEAAIEDYNTQIKNFQGAQAALDELIAKRDAAAERLARATGQNKKEKTEKPREYRGARLTGDQKDLFKEIEAERDELNAIEERKRLQNLISEEEYLQQIYNHNVSAINKKRALLRDSNAEEARQLGALNLEKVKEEVALNDKIYDIRLKAITEQRDLTIAAAKEKLEVVKSDPQATPSQIANAQLETNQQILDAQIKWNGEMDQLEKDRNDATIKNAEDRNRTVRTLQREVNDDTRDLVLAGIEDTKRAAEKLQAEFELTINRAIMVVLADKTLTQAQKNARIRILENERQFGILARQAAMYDRLEIQMKQALDLGIITLAQYEEIVKKLLEAQQKLANAPQSQEKGFLEFFDFKFGDNIISNLQKSFADFGESLFPEDPEQGKAVGEAFAEAIGQSYSLAADAMNSYFDAEQERIKENLEIQLERLEMEKEQVIARAQSQAEIDSLEKQYASKKKEEERKAHEQLKKSRKSEAKLALAAELANIWATVWQLGPIVAPIAGVAFSALAFGRYALRLKEINAEKFERGGLLEEQNNKSVINRNRSINNSLNRTESKNISRTDKRSSTKSISKSISRSIKSIFSKDSSKEITTTNKRNRKFIDNQEFTKRGGVIKGKKHKDGGTPFLFKKKPYEAEAKELAIVRTKNAPRHKRFQVSGTQMEIASAMNRIGGGVDFKPGAKIKMFETGGYIGQALQAPIMPNQTNTVINNANGSDGVSAEQLNVLVDRIEQLAREQSNRIDRIAVVQQTSTVAEALRKEVKQNSIGTL